MPRRTVENRARLAVARRAGCHRLHIDADGRERVVDAVGAAADEATRVPAAMAASTICSVRPAGITRWTAPMCG